MKKVIITILVFIIVMGLVFLALKSCRKKSDIQTENTAKVEKGNSGGAAISLEDDCYLGTPTYSLAGEIESLARILDVRVLQKSVLRHTLLSARISSELHLSGSATKSRDIVVAY